jgi:molybdopterin molybdotransferase
MVQPAPAPITRHWDDPTTMVGVDDARDLILSAFAPLPPVSLSIVDALGLVLTQDIVADGPIPPFPNSAMDGYAVRAVDTTGATPTTPVHLRVIGEAPAGYACSHRVESGLAVRIMTGAPIPDGADAVIRFEETDEADSFKTGSFRNASTVAIHGAVRSGDNVRPRGEDVAGGDTILAAGAVVRPAEIGVLASLGRTSVAVHRPPRVAILATGDEIVDPGTPLLPGQIHNSNSSTIAALVRRCGGEPILLGVARDTAGDIRAKLAQARQADLIVTSGGVSVGDYDIVKQVLQMDGRVDLWQVRIKPGKPLAFGRIGDIPLLGLPGNPVAAAVAFEQFARPAIRTMLGHQSHGIPTVQARLLDRVENRGGRRQFVRVHVETDGLGGYVARLAGSQGAGVLTSLMRANGLLVIPEEIAIAEPGMNLPVQMFDWQFG